MKRLLSDDSGAVATIVAIMLFAFIAIAAISIDQGYLFDTRRQLQSAADAAALAGCSKLIETKDPVAADTAARAYAAANASGAGINLVVESVVVDKANTPWSVRVSVTRDVPAWFASVFGPSSNLVRAVAKAEKQPLTGSRNVMPWALPTLEDDDIKQVNLYAVDGKGGTASSSFASKSAARQWTGSIPAPSTPDGYDLKVEFVTQVSGGPLISEWVGDSHGAQGAGRIVVPPTGYPFASVEVVNDWPASDEVPAITVNVKTNDPVSDVKLDVGKTKNLAMTGSGTAWTITLGPAELPFDDKFLDTFPVNVHVAGKDSFVDAYVHVRRSTYPVKSVAGSAVASAGEMVPVDIRLTDFSPNVLTPGQIYTLRVGSSGVETGNFGEINYSKLVHMAGCPPDPAGADLGNNVRDWIAEGYGGGLHIGDHAQMSPGNSGWTANAVRDRIAKYGPQIIVPVVARYEQKSGGSYEVVVRNFAAFTITQVLDDSTVRGEFIEYVANPSTYGTPPGGGTVFQARLVNP